MEIELENIKENEAIAIDTKTSWKSTIDNSLKDNGREFTCSFMANNARTALIDLFSKLENPKTSKRCSVHVHLNIYDLTEYQIWNIIYTYLVFERLLYKISGNRWTSNYCVPLQTFLFKKPSFEDLPQILKKYSGLHILADGSLSTLEFRHMRGSTSIDDIVDWINIITKIHNWSIHTHKHFYLDFIPESRSTSYYWQLLDEIFLEDSFKLKLPSAKEDIEYGITHTKLLMFG